MSQEMFIIYPICRNQWMEGVGDTNEVPYFYIYMHNNIDTIH